MIQKIQCQYELQSRCHFKVQGKEWVQPALTTTIKKWTNENIGYQKKQSKWNGNGNPLNKIVEYNETHRG